MGRDEELGWEVRVGGTTTKEFGVDMRTDTRC